jgi:hypothetical protein
MGRLFRGGDGIEVIPEWVEVNRPQAEALMEFKQSDNDPFSQRAFDIVTPELRKRIDQKENEFRMTMLGRGMPISEMPDVSANESSMVDGQATRKRITLDDLASGGDEAPGQILEAEGQIATPRQAQESSAITDDGSLAGRAAAAEGFEDTLDMNDGDGDGDSDDNDGDGDEATEAAAVTESSLPPTAPPPKAPKPARPPSRARK